jgi:hypothetical protein
MRAVFYLVNLGIELEREVSPAEYLWKSRAEFPDFGNSGAVSAAIDVGMALEHWQLQRARGSWRIVVAAARRAGRSARRAGRTSRRLASDIDRIRDSVETVLFDGRLPPDLAARSSRAAAKMCARVVEHALAAYWADAVQETPP